MYNSFLYSFDEIMPFISPKGLHNQLVQSNPFHFKSINRVEREKRALVFSFHGVSRGSSGSAEANSFSSVGEI